VPTYRLHDPNGDDLGEVEHPAPNVEPEDAITLRDAWDAVVIASWVVRSPMGWLRRRRTPERPRYEKHFEEPRPIDIPDWELLEEVEALLGPHSEKGLQGPYGAFAERKNGGVITYGVATVAELRAKVEERGAPLWAIRILKWIDDPKLVNGLYVKMHLTTGFREVFVSADGEDEASVDDMTARLAELVSRAADRYTAPPHPEPPRG
jgi:hypothetical protein